MNQIPIVPIANPYLVQQQTTYMPIPQQQQPNYNAVKIDIHNPSVGTQGVGQQYNPQYATPTMPYYSYPETQLYNYPMAQQPAYYPGMMQMPPYYMPQTNYPQNNAAQTQPTAPITQPIPQPAAVPAAPAAPQVAAIPQAPAAPQVAAIPQAPVAPQPVAPVVQQQNINVPQPVPVVVTNQQPIPVEVAPQQAVTPEPVVSTPVTQQPEATKTEAAKPEIVAPEAVTPQVDLNSFIAKLSNPDFDTQAAAMEDIATLIKDSPEKATELVDTKVFDSLTNIINFDSSKLEGPTPEQAAAREKIMTGKEVTEQEKTLANTITPKEQAERNKSYALFTSAMMQKLYADEVARLSNSTVPLTELPGVVTVVDQLKDNPNPMVRASAIEALSYLQNPTYKNDLTTVFTVAKNDVDPGVAEAAKIALDRLNQA